MAVLCGPPSRWRASSPWAPGDKHKAQGQSTKPCSGPASLTTMTRPSAGKGRPVVGARARDARVIFSKRPGIASLICRCHVGSLPLRYPNPVPVSLLLTLIPFLMLTLSLVFGWLGLSFVDIFISKGGL